MSEIRELLEKIDYAKNAVTWLLAHADGNVDFHGLVYWAGEVERLREEVKKVL
jgi:hypothetical protein